MTAATDDRSFIEEMRRTNYRLLREWSDQAEAEATIADVLRLCDLAQQAVEMMALD